MAKGQSKKRQRNQSSPQAHAPLDTSVSLAVSPSKKAKLSPAVHPSTNASTFTNHTSKKYLTPQDGTAFHDLVRDHYQGFVHIPADQVTPSNFHQIAKTAFEHLRDANYYQYDIVKAGGKHASRTFVKRTLVGEPGITYKYLGLRLFAHAWSGPGVSPVMKTIGDLNQYMIQMTKKYENHGKCDYNLTLINYMEPSSHSKVGFKDEAFYGMGKVSVSWHADSSLEKNSSIGVYHCLPSQRHTKWDWRIALRRTPESIKDADKILPIATSTKDGDAYFLLGTLNETHQHCVLSGSESNRISSTHRVAVTQEDTFDYIRKRAKGALKRFRLQLSGDTSQMDAKVIVYCQRVLTEIEMEWIAQYWLQGAEHDRMHIWWQRPMRTLEALWLSLEELTFDLYQLCIHEPGVVPRLVIKGFQLELESRHTQRQQWDERRADKIYQRRIQEIYRPVERPTFDATDKKRLGKDLEPAIQALQGIRDQQHLERSKKVHQEKVSVSNKSGVEAVGHGKSHQGPVATSTQKKQSTHVANGGNKKVKPKKRRQNGTRVER